MLNAEKYKESIKEVGYDFALVKGEIKDCQIVDCESCEFFKASDCTTQTIKWLLQEYKEPILDDIEKEYLSAVIKPFRKRIESIKKAYYSGNSAYISIAMNKCEHIFLPYFNLNSGMYKKMEINKEYTLKELDLL